MRAVLEGVAANSAWLMSYVERFTKRTLSPVRLLGGGAQSELWCQVYADTLARPVEQVPQPMFAQLRGVALAAAAAVRDVTYEEATAVVARGRVFTPDDDTVDLYRTRRAQVRTRFDVERRFSTRAASAG